MRLGAKYAFAWRADVLLAWTSAALVLLACAGTWRAAAASGGGDVAGATTWAVLGWAASRVTTSQLDQNLVQRVRSGQIATDLLKPIELVPGLMWRDLGRAVAACVVIALPLVCLGSMWGPLAVHLDPLAVMGSLCSLGLGVLQGSALAVCVGAVAVRTGRGEGAVALKSVVLPLVSGALVPHVLLPAQLQLWVRWLPTTGLAHVPAAWLMGGPRPWADVLAQIVWSVVLVTAARWAWSRTHRAVVVFGG